MHTIMVSRALFVICLVDVARVEALSVLQIAPGGHLGRFLIWSKPAIDLINQIFGCFETASKVKKGYVLPRAIMTNSALSRLINSDEIQSSVRAPKSNQK